MASKAGPRALGTDGGDFGHREKVGNHYKASSTNKWRFKFVSILHIGLVLLMVFRLSVSIFVMLGMRPPSSLQRLRLPKAEAWEWLWLCSVLSTIFGLFALKRNKAFLMQQYLIGTVVFGFGPCVYAMYHLAGDMMQYLNTRDSKKLFLGYPVVVLWFMFLAVCLQVHLFGLVFSWKLLKAWTVGTTKKRS